MKILINLNNAAATMAAALYILLIGSATSLSAQQNATWPFYLAFEDATGAVDTLWMVIDESATFELDSMFNEIALAPDDGEFRVYVKLLPPPAQDQFHVAAYPGIAQGQILESENYELPVIMKWDTSLFSLDVFPEGDRIIQARLNNDYFFFVNNDVQSNEFNMLWDDHVVMPAFNWGGKSQFPLSIDILAGFATEAPERKSIDFALQPNPVHSILSVISQHTFKSIRILNQSGKTVKLLSIANSSLIQTVDVSNLAIGAYFLMCIGANGERGVSKFAKL